MAALAGLRLLADAVAVEEIHQRQHFFGGEALIMRKSRLPLPLRLQRQSRTARASAAQQGGKLRTRQVGTAHPDAGQRLRIFSEFLQCRPQPAGGKAAEDQHAHRSAHLAQQRGGVLQG